MINATLLTEQNYLAMAFLGALHNVFLQWLWSGGVVGVAPMFLIVTLLVAKAAWREGAIAAPKLR